MSHRHITVNGGILNIPSCHIKPGDVIGVREKSKSLTGGDSLATFLERHGINKEELKRFNPGLKLSELSAGNTVQVAKAKPGQQLMAIRPSVSGGASWPIRPDLSQLQSTNRPSLQLSPSTTYRWPTKGTFTSGSAAQPVTPYSNVPATTDGSFGTTW